MGGAWAQRDAWYESRIHPYYSYSWPVNFGYRSRPRSYSSKRFTEDWKDRDPEICDPDDGLGSCAEAETDALSDSVLLSEGMDQEEVMLLLGSPLQSVKMGEREVWKYSAFSLLFEFGTLKEIR
jgi:hypothetical protein